jgi:hypothetical protein
VSLSLGVTFPLNIVLGIPLYTQVVPACMRDLEWPLLTWPISWPIT